MLLLLSIKNFALIDSLELSFGLGFNVMTGETGAGKSIIVDAFLAALGERTSADVIRSGQQRATIEAVFSTQDSTVIPSFLLSHDIEELDGALIIRRELYLKGSTRYFINDTPAQSHVVKELGNLLVDFHGQHEHQSILKPEKQLQILDDLANSGELLRAYKSSFQELKDVVQTFKDLVSKEQELREKQAYQRVQLDEIESIAPTEGEDESLAQELSLLSNAEELFAQSDAAYQVLYAADTSARDALIKAQAIVHHLQTIDERFVESSGELDSVVISVDELAKSLKRYNANIEFQPERIEEIRERLVLLQRLRKRYGSLQGAIDFQKKLHLELSFIENYEQETKRYKARIHELQHELGQKAMALSKNRLKVSAGFDSAVCEHLVELGIEHAQFVTECRLQVLSASEVTEIYAVHGTKKYSASISGIDSVRFLASMNKGEDVKSLDRVLSGGEASRIMLAMKSVLAQADNVPLVVFDEIDVGVSGRIARKVGVMMKKLGRTHQVIAITHQAQIASLGETHFSVMKLTEDGHTTVSARVLNEAERVHEVAKLISGEKVTPASLRSATELLTDESVAVGRDERFEISEGQQ